MAQARVSEITMKFKVPMRSTPWPFTYSVCPEGGLVVNTEPLREKRVEATSDFQHDSVRDALAERGIRSTSPKRRHVGNTGEAGVQLDWKAGPTSGKPR